MAQPPVTERFYPALSEVITADDLPEFLHFAEQGLNVVLQSIYYKNLQFSKSYRGDAAFYSLDIISKNIGIDLPFGLRFVLNPDEDGDTSISSFPISLEYQWELLAFLRSFNVQNFAYTPEAFFALGLQVFRITDAEVVAQSMNYFIDEDTAGNSKFSQLVADINAFYPSANLTLPSGQEPTPDLVAELISQNPNIPDTVSEALFSIYIVNSDPTDTSRNLRRFFALMVPDGIEQYIRNLLIPKVRATLTLSAAIEFPNTVLKPVDAAGQPLTGKSLFKFAEATFYADTEGGIGADVELSGSLNPEYNQIGNTGLIIGFTGAKLDLSRTTNIPEADAAGYPVDFMGLYVQHATIGFMRFGEADTAHTSALVQADNLFIGTGGVSGRIALESNGVLYRKFNSFSVELNVFALEFRQNSIISSDIRGQLTVNKWKQNGAPAVIDIEAHIHDNGDFSITAIPQTALKVITLPNVLEVEILSFELGREQRGFYIEVYGVLSFIADLPVLGDVLPKGIQVKGLRIWDDGDLELRGGGIQVAKAFRLNTGPVNLEVTNLSLGAYNRMHLGLQRKYRYFGFDGMINTGRAGVNATGNGIKFYFTVDDNTTDRSFDCFISIDGIRIDMTLPGDVSKEDAAFLLNGYLSVKNPDPNISGSQAGSEYSGSVAFSMPRMKMGGTAGMRLSPGVPSFIVDIGLELATPIPLGATGLGIYGFRGLIGQHYMASKSATTPPLSEDASWWDYYKARSVVTGREGVEIDKFADKPGYSVGAGLSIATSFDSGKIFSTKLFLYLGLPNVFLLQGQAGILRSRIGLNDDVDPPFSALIAIDNSSFRGNLAVNYRLPEGGSLDGLIFTLNGTLDMAFFFNNASGWYLNIGKDQPENARVRTRILTLFQGYAYLMISSRGFKAGAGARFDFNKKFGPVAVGFGASIDLGGYVSFSPVQIGAFIQVGGYAYLKVFFFKFGLSVQLGLAVEAPRPFNISGYMQVRLNLPWPFKDIKFNLEVSWYFNNDDSRLREPIPVLQLPDPAAGYIPVTATNVLSGETFTVNYLTYEIGDQNVTIPAPGAAGWKYNFNNSAQVKQVTIPLDSFIDVELRKPVRPGEQKIGGASNQLPSGYSELVPPQKGRGPQARHEFELNAVDIYAWRETSPGTGTWVPYNIYQAVTAIVDGNTGPGAIDLAALKQGYWQFSEPGMYNKIRLMSQNMFSYSDGSTDAVSDLDALNFRRKDVFCFENVLKEISIDWKEEAVGLSYPPNTAVYLKGANFTLNGLSGQVASSPFGKSLLIGASGGQIIIRMPKPASTIKLDFGANANAIRIDYVQRVYRRLLFGRAFPMDEYKAPQFLASGQQNQTVTYNDLNNPIDVVILTFGKEDFLDYSGNLIIGGHFSLPQQYVTAGGLTGEHVVELSKSVVYASIFNKAFSAPEVIALKTANTAGRVGQWPLDSMADRIGDNWGILTGDPDYTGGYFQPLSGAPGVLRRSFLFSSNRDSVFVPYAPELKVENGSFSAELTALFSPYTQGISTLMYKVNQDPESDDKMGFAVHLFQNTPGSASTSYPEADLAPSFKIWVTFYRGTQTAGLQASAKYTVDYATSKLAQKQYKHILVSVNRTTAKVDIFIDRVPVLSAALPSIFSPYTTSLRSSYLNAVRYLTEVQQRKAEDNSVTREGLINEVELIGNNLNKTIQPVWRPNTTFAVVIKTRDVVNGNAPTPRSHVFGFRTAGPLGHFHQQSVLYDELKAQDRTAEFKLASLKGYIDYERSYPDAQSRYDLSKPVFFQDPQIRLFFTKPYLNAMFEDWDIYQGLPAVNSSLGLQVIDPFGLVQTPELVWEESEQEVTIENYRSLPADQQILFLMNLAALQDGCNEHPVSVKRKIRRGVYQIPDLLADRLYTALFTADYQPSGQAQQRSEIHKFSFRTSRYASFEQQASSLVQSPGTAQEHFNVISLELAFSSDQINNQLLPLIDNNPANDPASVLRFAVKFDRLVYGGLQLTNLFATDQTVIQVLVNVAPDAPLVKRILGLLIYNAEPFNDPKLPEELLSDTVQIWLSPSGGGNQIGPASFQYIHSRDTSAVLITNAAMNLPQGNIQLRFRYKLFNGASYENHDYTSPQIPIILTNQP